MQTGRSRPGALYAFVLLAVLIEAPLAWIRAQANLPLQIVEMIGVLLSTSIFYILSVWLLLKSEPRATRPLTTVVTLLAALVFRLTLFSLYPTFSDDPYRYRWEGKIQTEGFNPYTHPPDDPALANLRDSVHRRIGNPELPAVYGPLIELQQAAAYAMISRAVPEPGMQIFWFKLIPAAADLGVIGLLALLLARRRLPVSRILIYAWCPLPMFEFWATGHNDAILLFLLTLALVLAAGGSRLGSFCALSLAAMTKFWPSLLLPSFTGWRWRRLLAGIGILAAVTVGLWIPYRADLSLNVRLTSGFLGGWRNNDSLHGVIAALAPDPYAAKYVTTALIVFAAWAVSRLRWALEARTLAFIVAMLALSANVHPWYLTWIVPLLALYPIPALLLWTALMPVTYAVLIEWKALGVWDGTTGWRWMVYIPVMATAAIGVVLRRVNR